MKDFFRKIGEILLRPAQEIAHHVKGTDAQINILREELKAAEGRTSRLEDRLSNAEGKISKLEKAISELERLTYGRLDDGK